MYRPIFRWAALDPDISMTANGHVAQFLSEPSLTRAQRLGPDRSTMTDPGRGILYSIGAGMRVQWLIGGTGSEASATRDAEGARPNPKWNGRRVCGNARWRFPGQCSSASGFQPEKTGANPSCRRTVTAVSLHGPLRRDRAWPRCSAHSLRRCARQRRLPLCPHTLTQSVHRRAATA